MVFYERIIIRLNYISDKLNVTKHQKEIPVVRDLGGTTDRDSGYPHLSPYSYCAANPIRYIDPTREDIWRINGKGEVVEHTVTQDFDKFEFVDKDNNIIKNDQGEEQVLQFEYGTVRNYRQEKYAGVKSSNYGEKSGVVDIFEIRGNDAGTAVFEMFSQNVTQVSDNEIGLIRTGNTSNGPNFITSGHQQHCEVGGQVLYNGQLKYLYYLREWIHSHSENSIVSDGDEDGKNKLLMYSLRFNHSSPRFYIYNSKLKQYVEY